MTDMHEVSGVNKVTNSSIKQALIEVLDERDGIDRETHHAHHQFVEELIERRKRRDAMHDKIKATVIGSLIIASIGGALKFLQWVYTLWESAGKHLHK